MREAVMAGMENSDRLWRQFGLHRFDEDEEWWPEALRREQQQARDRINAKRANGGSHAEKVRSNSR